MEDPPTKQMMIGVGLVVVGVALFVPQLGGWSGWQPHQLWPLLLMAVGAARIARHGDGWLLVGYAAILLMDTLHILRLGDSWPLFIVLHGTMMIARPRTCGRPRERVTAHVD